MDGIHILGRRFHPFGSSEGGIEGARLWLRNSRAIFASWGAVSGSQSLVGKLSGRYFSGLVGACGCV